MWKTRLRRRSACIFVGVVPTATAVPLDRRGPAMLARAPAPDMATVDSLSDWLHQVLTVDEVHSKTLSTLKAQDVHLVQDLSDLRKVAGLGMLPPLTAFRLEAALEKFDALSLRDGSLQHMVQRVASGGKQLAQPAEAEVEAP